MSSIFISNQPFQTQKVEDLFGQNENEENEEEFKKKIIDIIVSGGNSFNINQEFIKAWVKYTFEQLKTINEQKNEYYKLLNLQKRQEIVGPLSTKELLKGCDSQRNYIQNDQQISMTQIIENLSRLIDDKIQKSDELKSFSLAAAQLEVKTCLEQTQQFLSSLKQYQIELGKKKITTSSGFNPDVSIISQNDDAQTYRQQNILEQLQSPSNHIIRSTESHNMDENQ